MPGESVGSLNILGEANFSDIVSELDRLEKKLGRIENSSKHLNIELERSGGRLKNMTKSVVNVGGLIGGAISGLAALAPSLADEWAAIGIATFNMAERLGTQIEPEMQNLVGHINNLITGWDSLDEGTKEWITDLGLVVGGTGALIKIASIIGIGGSLLTGMGAIIAATIAWDTNLFGVRDTVEDIAKSLEGFGADVGNIVWPAVQQYGDILSRAATDYGPAITEQVFASIQKFMGSIGGGYTFVGGIGVPNVIVNGNEVSGGEGGTSYMNPTINLNIRFDPSTGEIISEMG